MWAAAAGTIAYSSKRISSDLDSSRVPLMGVLGAFVFAAQMINFTIPGTGSSGHLGGGMLLAILLGPHAALLTIASVLTVQALFFADGGLLALGANIINLGFLPCFVAYPLVYRVLAGSRPAAGRRWGAILASSVAALQLGAFGVVLQTVLSQVTELPLLPFAAVMQPIHLAIGLVEGVVTAAVIAFVWKARPEMALGAGPSGEAPGVARPMLVTLLLLAALTGGVLAWFASERPDGLEWSIARVAGELEGPRTATHSLLDRLQQQLAPLPDYGFPVGEGAAQADAGGSGLAPGAAGTSLAGLVGGGLTLMLSLLIGRLLRSRSRH